MSTKLTFFSDPFFKQTFRLTLYVAFFRLLTAIVPPRCLPERTSPEIDVDLQWKQLSFSDLFLFSG